MFVFWCFYYITESSVKYCISVYKSDEEIGIYIDFVVILCVYFIRLFMIKIKHTVLKL